MRRTIPALLILALVAAGCVIRIPGSGTVLTLSDNTSVEVRDGTYYVHGVPLEHKRWVTLEGVLDDAEELGLESAAGDIDVTGGQGRAYALEVLLHSEIEGDGEVVLDGGRLSARSLGDGEVLIDSIRGTAPNDIAVRCDSGMGDVQLAGFSGGHGMRVELGMGSCTVRDCGVGDLDIENGMGEVVLEGVDGRAAVVESGMGGGRLAACRFDSLDVDLGMGSLEVSESSLGELRADLGMGSLELHRCQVAALEADLGMGDLVLDGTPRPARCAVDTGLGRVREG